MTELKRCVCMWCHAHCSVAAEVRQNKLLGISVDEMSRRAPGRGLSVYSLEETDKLLMPMAGHAVADHLAIEHVEGCK